jgi:hypothetical protein
MYSWERTGAVLRAAVRGVLSISNPRFL